MRILNKKSGYGPGWSRGFTLIELLIVVAIIGLLASIVLVSVGSFRAQARDARRAADLRETQKALELFYTRNTFYPPASSWDQLTITLVNAGVGINAIANDPLYAVRTYVYGVSSDGQNYALAADLEVPTNVILKDDVDGTLYGVNCADGGTGTTGNWYCIQF